MMIKKIGVVFFLVFSVSSLGCAKKIGCESKNVGSFGSFLDDEWRTYCEEYEARVSEPLEFDLIELAEFFGTHEEKVDNLHQSLIRFKDAKSCFDTGRKKLEYRELKSCITYDEEQDSQMEAAFLVAFEPWFDDVKHAVEANAPRIKKETRESTRLLNQASLALKNGRTWHDEGLVSHRDRVRTLRKELAKARKRVSIYDELKQGLGANGALRSVLDMEYSDEVEALSARLNELHKKVKKLDDTAKFFAFTKVASGRRCPERASSNQQAKTVKKVFADYIRNIEGGGVRIDGAIDAFMDEETKFKTEAFTGFVCGSRVIEKGIEFPDDVCAIHRFEVSRVKDRGYWTDWEGEIEEGGVKDSVDCSHIQ